MAEYRYETLSDADCATLMRARLRRVEAEHFEVALEVRLAGTTGEADKYNPAAQVELAMLEVKAAALKTWLGMREPLPPSDADSEHADA